MLLQHVLLHCTLCVYIGLCLIILPPFDTAPTTYIDTLYTVCTFYYALLHCHLFYTTTPIYFLTLSTVCILWIMIQYTATISILLPQQTLLHCTLDVYIKLSFVTLHTVCIHCLGFVTLHTVCMHWIMPHYTTAFLYCCHNIHCTLCVYIGLHYMTAFFYTAATTYFVTLDTVYTLNYASLHCRLFMLPPQHTLFPCTLCVYIGLHCYHFILPLQHSLFHCTIFVYI